MTLYEYKLLSEDEQYDTVFSKGKFLDIYIDGTTKYVLYALDIFFVEVIWDIAEDQIIGKEENYGEGAGKIRKQKTLKVYKLNY